MKAAIVILNYNGRSHLETFLPSVIAHSPAWAEIIVADNGSTDDSLLFLKNTYPNIRTIKFAENHGFAGGYNLALREIDAPYYVLLNSDVEVTPNWLDIIIHEMDANDQIAAAQPKIKSYKDRGHFEYAGASGGFIDKYGFPFCRGRIFDNCERDIGQHNDNREIFWATGACLVVRSKAYHDAEGFDKDFFAHMEEIDLCWRLKNQGYQIYCFPQSTVFHLGGGTLSAQKPHKTYLNFRNGLTLMIKNDYRKGFFRILFTRMVLDGIAAVSFIFSRGISHSIAVVRSHFYLYGNFRILRKKRRYWRERKVTYNQTGFYRKSIVKDYYVRKMSVFGALPSRYFIRQDRTK